MTTQNSCFDTLASTRERLQLVESYGSLPSQQNTVSNLSYLRNRVSFRRAGRLVLEVLPFKTKHVASPTVS